MDHQGIIENKAAGNWTISNGSMVSFRLIRLRCVEEWTFHKLFLVITSLKEDLVTDQLTEFIRERQSSYIYFYIVKHIYYLIFQS